MAKRTRSLPQFSILSVLLATTVVALAITAGTATSQLGRLRRELLAANDRIRSLEGTVSTREARNQQEFFGLHGEPILSIDPRLGQAPWMIRVLNCKSGGQVGTFWVGPGGEEGIGTRYYKVDLRLLRSLDKKDYYRLTYWHHVQGAAPADSEKESLGVLLFEYEGHPQLLVAEDSVAIAIAPDRESSVTVAASAYAPHDADERRQAWLQGPQQAQILTLFSPSGRWQQERNTGTTRAGQSPSERLYGP